MIQFNMPRDTRVSSIAVAVDRTALGLKPLIVGLEDRDLFLRHLRLLCNLANGLWLGAVILEDGFKTKRSTFSFMEYSHCVKEEWAKLESAAFDDASDRELSVDNFLFPIKRGRHPYHGCEFEPHAQMGLKRMLSCQFSLVDNPSLFLIRQLAMRILFKAYVRNITETVKSKFVDLVREMKLSREWQEAAELQFAAEFHIDKMGMENSHFGDIVLHEVAIMKDILELALRQFQDPLPAEGSEKKAA